MQDIYAALRVQNLAPANGSTQFVSGDQLYFNLDLVNTSANPLIVPLKKEHGATAYWVGTQQTWIERLGADPTIPSLSGSARDGNLYATGGSLWAVDSAFPDGTIPAGGIVPSSVALDTTGFPPGQYRYYVNYVRVNNSRLVVDRATIDISTSS